MGESIKGREGIAEALLAATLFGLSAPAGKKLLGGDVSPQMLAGLLYAGSGFGLGALWFARRRRGPKALREPSLRTVDLPVLAVSIGFGGVLAPLLLMAGLQRTPASAASLLLNLEAIFTALLAWVVFGESASARIVAGMVAIVSGGLILSSSERAHLADWLGPLYVAGACLCWGVDNNVTQKISARDPVQTAAIKGLVAGAVNGGLALLVRNSWPGTATIALALLLGFFCYGASLVFYIRALRRLGTSRTGNYFSLAPFIGAVVSLVVLRDPVTLSLLAAAGFMALGLWLHVTERHEHVHRHEAMDHEHMHVHDEHHRHAHGPGDPPGEPHSHPHHHDAMEHIHEHYPDIHHRHTH
jgi:drug/metabolite transporter (DMT)-like permease